MVMMIIVKLINNRKEPKIIEKISYIHLFAFKSRVI